MSGQMAELRFADLIEVHEGTALNLGLRWALASSYAERLEILEACLEYAYNHLVEGRKHYSEFSEDALNVMVTGILSTLNIQVEHDAEVGGHCDILVRAADSFLWIGEAKLQKGAKNTMGGFLQLSTRYGVAQPGRDHGEIIIYCQISKAVRALELWKDFLDSSGHCTQINEISSSTPLEFRSIHECESTGLPFYVRHRIVPLYHNPKK